MGAGQDAAIRGAVISRRLRDTRRYDVVFVLALVALAGLTLIAVLVPIAIHSVELDLLINTVATIAAALAGGLSWIRYREYGERPALIESAAFLIIYSTGALRIAALIAGISGQIGLQIDAPQQWPAYGWTLARAFTAILLILAAVEALKPRPGTRIPAQILHVLPTATLLLFIAALPVVEASLPVVLDERAFAALRGDADGQQGMRAAGLFVQGAIAALFLLGAGLHRQIYRRGERQYSGYLAIALVVAAFTQLHWSIMPTIYSPVVGTDDVLRALFSIILLLGIEVQSRSDVHDLRLANTRLDELRAVDVERAALATRAQMARDIHDGLAQELWFAKLKSGRLSQMPELSSESRELASEVGAAVDRALVDARTALTAIRAGLDGEPAMAAALEGYVIDFAERAGLQAEFTAAPDLPSLPSRSAAEVLRIVLEAMTNVQKHADATTVRVEASAPAGDLQVSVTDNGRGFDPVAGDGERFGIRGMRERAELIGADLQIASQPREGTTVTLRVPAAVTRA